MPNNSMGFLNRLLTAFMLVVVLIACEKMPENHTLKIQPINPTQIQK
jgi:hypothetical protein